MQQPLVQILVVVANIQVTVLKTEVEKGFVRTANGHELIDPKTAINFEKATLLEVLVRASNPGSLAVLKGKQVNIPAFGSRTLAATQVTPETPTERLGRVFFSC